MDLTGTIAAFKAHQAKLRAYGHALGALSYDAETAMPQGASEQLGVTLGILSEEVYKLRVNDELRAMAEEIIAAKEDPAVSFQTLREAEDIAEELHKLAKIPMDEYVAFQVLENEASHIWHSAKVDNDYAAFEPCLNKLVETQRRFAKYMEPEKDAYDTWLDEFEKGLNSRVLDDYFAKIRTALVPLIREISKAEQPRADFLKKSYPLPLQRELSDYLMNVLTIDRAHCNIGEVEHPFTTEFNKFDVRITTHYHEDMMASNMYSVIHEGGHALYELNTGDELVGSVLAGGSSMGIHESQSRFYENIIGRSREFTSYIFPELTRLFPEQLKGVSSEDFYRAVNIAKPSLIRTEADELTYSLHIMVRYELEKRLMDGSLSTKELPKAWNELYREYLGVTVPSDREGVLQDSHWSSGSFGYFPSYSIGSAYSAQMLSAMQKDMDVFAYVAKGELHPIVGWLTDRIYRYGQLKKPAELVLSACNAPFDPEYYITYLTDKFSTLYGL